MHDHNKRGKRFCPLMKEMCNQGWTPSMGKDEDDTPKFGICAAWQPVSIVNKQERQTMEQFDCSVYGWTTDLLFSIANEVQYATASTDKVANEVNKHHGTFIATLPEDQKRILISNDPRQKLLPRSENGDKER